MEHQTISAFEAKTHLSQLLVQVKKGQEFLITKYGEPVALLIPFKEKSYKNYGEIIRNFRKFFLTHPCSLGESLSVQSLKKEGQR